MDINQLNDSEIAPGSAVLQAARRFAEVLADTPEFREFEQAYYSYRQDAEAKQVIREFQQKQASLKAFLMLNAVGDEDQRELKRLQEKYAQQPSVIRYTKAQEALVMIAQETGDLLSNAIGLDYGNSCKTGGCCG